MMIYIDHDIYINRRCVAYDSVARACVRALRERPLTRNGLSFFEKKQTRMDDRPAAPTCLEPERGSGFLFFYFLARFRRTPSARSNREGWHRKKGSR